MNQLTNNIKTIAIGKKILLREYRTSDMQLFTQWLQNEELASYAFGITTTKENIRKITDSFCIEVSQTPKRTITIIDLDKIPVGFIRITNVFFPIPHIVIGIMLGNFENCGHSIGYEALMLAINYLFNNYKIFYIELDTAIFNERAMRCFLKCGFKIVKNFDETEYVTKVKMHKTLFRLNKSTFLSKYEEYIKETGKIS